MVSIFGYIFSTHVTPIADLTRHWTKKNLQQLSALTILLLKKKKNNNPSCYSERLSLWIVDPENTKWWKGHENINLPVAKYWPLNLVSLQKQ